MLPSYRKPEQILKLEKALYGLRISPLLWQKELTATLTDLGFAPVPYKPCCFIKEGIIIFFYVDDIVCAFRKEQELTAQELIRQLKKKYQLTGGDKLQWFLRIKVVRDRDKRLIWLS